MAQNTYYLVHKKYIKVTYFSEIKSTYNVTYYFVSIEQEIISLFHTPLFTSMAKIKMFFFIYAGEVIPGPEMTVSRDHATTHLYWQNARSESKKPFSAQPGHGPFLGDTQRAQCRAMA